MILGNHVHSYSQVESSIKIVMLHFEIYNEPYWGYLVINAVITYFPD